MHLILHLPAADSQVYDWSLLDRQGVPLRAGQGALESVPRAERITAVIPANRVLFTELKLPPVSAARLHTLLPFAIEDKLMSDPATIVALPGAANPAGERVVAVVDKAWLQRQLAQLRDAGMTVDSVLPQSELTARESGLWTAVLPADKREGFLVRDDGFALAFDIPGDGGPPLAVTLALKEAGESAPRAITALAAQESDVTAWSATLGLPVQWRAAQWRVPASSPFDFLSHPALRIFAKRSDWQSAWPAFKPAVMLAAGLAVLYLGALALDVFRLTRQQDALREEMVSLFRSTFPEARAIVDPALQLSRNVEQLKRDRGLASDPVVPALAQAADWVKAAGARVESLKFDGRKLSLELALSGKAPAAASGLTFAAAADGKRGTLVAEVAR